jgi:hypothetical protein
MGCDAPHLDGSLHEDDEHALADCVVWLDAAPQPPSPETVRRLVVEPCGYSPRVSAARAPLRLELENRATGDALVHAYRETLGETVFDLAVAPGRLESEAGSLHLGAPGLYLVRCDTVASYTATLHLFAHPWFDVTSVDSRSGRRAGEFLLADVPAGEHRLVAWHEAVLRTPVALAGAARPVSYSSGPAWREERRVRVEPGAAVVVDLAVR